MDSHAIVPHLSFGNATVRICPDITALGQEAARDAAEIIEAAISSTGHARVLIATGNSQLALITALTERNDVNWNAVEAFHMDEYIGISRQHPSSFRYWIRTRFEERVSPARMHYMEGDANDTGAEMARYASLLAAAPMDLAFVGFGENGHIAFNDPPVADFNDPAVVKKVLLDDACRRQQAGEGHFPDINSVPKEAMTVTCPELFRAHAWICSVPEARKAEAVRSALTGPISPACPASLVRRHPRARVYLDIESARLLPRD